MEYLLLFLGFILVIKSSDVLVEASKSIAIRLKVPKMLIALTIVAFGTCAPELAISFNSVISNNGSVALANVVGSCIVNILLVIGMASIFSPIRVKNATIKKELPLLVLVTVLFVVIVSNSMLRSVKNNYLNSIDGLFLLLLFGFFIVYLIRLVKKRCVIEIRETPKYGMIKSSIYLLLSIVVICYSADMIVDNAIIIANNIGISQKIITMVAIVIGTSLPELFLTVTAARKKEHEMAIGNIIGTNIFNICVVLGLPMFLYNGFRIVDFNLIDIGIVLVSALSLFLFARNDRKLSKKEGFIMLGVFVLYYLYVIFV